MKWINTQFGDDLKGLFIDNLSSHEAIIKRHRQIQVSLLDFEDIKLFKYLGAGSYGAVHLVQNMKDNHMLALKSISKKLINNQTALQLLKNEKEILSFIEFPLVINMEAMHKEEKYIHFFIEFVDGLPFDDVLMKLDTLSEWQTCFYTSQVILMLDYLHCHGIVYRDLKAQNIICSTDVDL
jgi:serine/threonine protein kinase